MEIVLVGVLIMEIVLVGVLIMEIILVGVVLIIQIREIALVAVLPTIVSSIMEKEIILVQI